MDRQSKKGLSLIEGLIIAAIVGLMGTLAAIALDSARERARDAKRLADVTRLQAALELYFNDANSYPVTEEFIALGQSTSLCLSDEGLSGSCDKTAQTVYMNPVPSTPEDGLHDLVGCSQVANAYCFAGGADTYAIEFELENESPEASLQKGVNCATESEVKAGSCE